MIQDDIKETCINKDGFFADVQANQTACSVRVALRVRPLLPKEIYENSRICLDSNFETNTVSIGKDRCFTFDKTFDMFQSQEVIFELCVKNLVLGCFSGFNATVLAYGQTGSGKTYTMGSGFTLGVKEEELGIIPRGFLDKMVPLKKEISIREEKNGSISVYGLTEETVKSETEMANFLDIGSHARRTAATLMNQASSRSHAIFTITIEQNIIGSADSIIGQEEIAVENKKPKEFTVAKFHFVDLAGSERAKKTGATGTILKEGININKSLLALGNVISALTENKQSAHIPYRDSKLTRILQDSLGGNSRTSMIACCSPAEINFEETLNTLKYASRARNIQNKPVFNRDPTSQQILDLRQQVFDLQKELISHRKVMIQNGIQIESQIEIHTEQILSQNNNQFGSQTLMVPNTFENTKLTTTSSIIMNQQSLDKDNKIQQLEQQVYDLKAQNSQLEISLLENLRQKDQQKLMSEHLIKQLQNLGYNTENYLESLNFETEEVLLLDQYRQKNISLEKEVTELQAMLRHLQTDNLQLIEQSQRDNYGLEQKQIEIEKQNRSIQQMQSQIHNLRQDLSKIKQRKGEQILDNNEQNWLSSDLDHKIKHFDDIRQRFIETLGNQMSSLITNEGQQITPLKTSNYENVQMEQSDDEGIESDIQDEDGGRDFALQEIEQDQDHLPNMVLLDNEKKIIMVSEQQEQLQEQEIKIQSIDTLVKDKENLLQDLKNAQMELQNSLVLAMKEEFHKHIESINKEKIRLEQQKSVEMQKVQSVNQRRTIEDQFKSKLQELQNQLQLLTEKERRTKQMQKAYDDQQKKVKSLENDLQQMKTSRIIMLKKAKEDSDKLKQLKSEQAKQLLKLQQQNLRNQQENIKLKRDVNKKDIFAKRKAEELNAIQARQRMQRQVQNNCLQQRQMLKQVNLDHIKDWILENNLKMLENQELQTDLQLKKHEFNENEHEINLILDLKSKALIQVEKIEQEMFLLTESNSDQRVIQERLSLKANQFKSQIEECQERIECLESKQNFLNTQILKLIRSLSDQIPDEIDQDQMKSLKSIEGAHACITLFFKLLFDSNYAKNLIQRECDYRRTQVEEQESQIKLLEREIMYREKILSDNQLKYQQREQIIFEQIAKNFNINLSEVKDADINKLIEIYFQKQDQQQLESNKIQSQLSNEKNRQVNKVVQPSLKDARNARKLKKAEISNSTNQQEDILAESLNNNYQTPKQSSFEIQEKRRPHEFDNKLSETHMWKVGADEKNSHKSSVLALSSLGHNLYSSSQNSLKIWDLNKMQVVAELTKDIGLVKQIKICKQQKLIFIANEKKIVIWDLIGLTKVTEYTSQPDHDIRCIELTKNGDFIFVGTKSTIKTGALLIFDIKKNLNKPIEEREVNEDIRSLSLTSKYLFINSFNKFKRLDLQNFQSTTPETIDNDITQLQLFRNSLITLNNKENTIESYDIESFQKQSSIAVDKNDQISCLSADNRNNDFDQLYTGCRNGVVNVWRDNDLKCKAKLIGNDSSSSVNAICSVENNNEQSRMIACANSDKSIRILKQDLQEENSALLMLKNFNRKKQTQQVQN